MTQTPLFQPHGNLLIDQQWFASDEGFQNTSTAGSSATFSNVNPVDVDAACQAAERAFWSYNSTTREEHAAFLNAIADEVETGAALVKHPLITAVRFTGSLTMGAGQFHTNPGLAIVIAGPDADRFAAAGIGVLSQVGTQTMLTEGISNAYRAGSARISASTGERDLLTTSCDQRGATPNLALTTGAQWLANETLGKEVFSSMGLQDIEGMQAMAQSLHGELTCTLQMDDGDTDVVKTLLPILTRKAGRVLANGFPTEVEVSDTMVHGGPYPASTNFGATWVGTLAIRGFLHPVCYQNLPSALLPADLAELR